MKKLLFVAPLLVVMVFTVTTVALAAPAVQDGDFPSTLDVVLATFSALAGWPALLAAVINILKTPIIITMPIIPHSI